MTEQLQSIESTDFDFPGLIRKHSGKVRDIYEFEDKIALVATDRISAFDVILPRAIPRKGEVLNLIAARNLEATADVAPNWVTTVADPNATIGIKCKPYPVEMVVRGYLAGHAWREYSAGRKTVCGVTLPAGLKENDKLPDPIITPTTKAAEGHDEDISREEILSRGVIPKAEYEQMEKYSLALFKRGSEMAAERELILVDTKYEFGKHDGKVMLIDEIHTPDSSRYFIADGYEQRQHDGERQRQLSKEFVREWLMANGFQGKEGEKVPEMTDEVVAGISARYLELFYRLIGHNLGPQKDGDPLKRIFNNISNNL